MLLGHIIVIVARQHFLIVIIIDGGLSLLILQKSIDSFRGKIVKECNLKM